MPVAPPGVLAPSLLEHHNFRVARLLLDGARYFCMRHSRPPDDRRRLGADEQDLVDDQVRADLDVELLRDNHVVFRNFVLRAAQADDGEAVAARRGRGRFGVAVQDLRGSSGGGA